MRSLVVHKYVALFLMIGTLLLSTTVHAAFNQTLTYQARITDSSGFVIADGSYDMTFRLYDALTAGTLVWSESHTGGSGVTAANGFVSAQLGSIASLAAVNFDQPLYLSVEFNNDGEMSPRKPITAAPAAFVAGTSGLLDGLDSLQFLRSDAAGTLAAGSATTLLTLNQTGGGNLLDIRQSGSSKFTLNNAGALAFNGLAGTAGQVLQSAGTGAVPTWVNAGTGLSLNGLLFGTSPSQTFATATTGTDFGITSSGSTHTFSLPSASATARGLVTIAAQTFAGDKTFSGKVGVGGVIPVATFHNAGSTIFSVSSIANLATGGAIGTAAATVDVFTNFNINQTTTNQTLTLPTPTATDAGRIIYINNIGTAGFTMLSERVEAGQSRQAIWNGTAWKWVGDQQGLSRVSVTLGANQTYTNNAVAANVAGLSFAIAAGESWYFDLSYEYTTGNSGTPDIRFAVTNSGAGATCSYHYVDDSSAPVAGSIMSTSTCGTAVIVPSTPTAQKGGNVSGVVTATGAGTIQIQSAQGVSNATSTILLANGTVLNAFKLRGADLAEVYFSSDDQTAQGTIVSVAGDGARVRASSQKYDSKMLGIISTKPGLVIGDTDAEGSPVVVGLAGRVPVRVNNENGPIVAGDYITASSTPGVGMKSTEPGMVIGKALTSFDSDSEGTVLLFIQNTYFDGVYDTETTLDSLLDGVTSITQVLTPADSTAARTVYADGTIADRFTHLVRRAIEKLSNWYMDIVLWVREIKTDKLTIGDTDTPNGFTMFDTATGAPYCVSITNGQLQSIGGACGQSATASGSNVTDSTTGSTSDSGSITDTATDGSVTDSSDNSTTDTASNTSSDSGSSDSAPVSDTTSSDSAPSDSGSDSSIPSF